MTQREFFNAIANLTNIDSELVEFAASSIEKMDAQAEARRSKQAEKAAEKQAEKAPVREALKGALTDEPKTAAQLIEELGLEIGVRSIPSLMRPFVDSGEIAKVDVKINGKTYKGYVLA